MLFKLKMHTPQANHWKYNETAKLTHLHWRTFTQYQPQTIFSRISPCSVTWQTVVGHTVDVLHYPPDMFSSVSIL